MTIAGLADWDGVAIAPASLPSLVQFASSWPPPHDMLVVPADVGASVLRTLPFRRRTVNGLIRAVHLRMNKSVSVGDLLALRSFGFLSLIDAMCVIESAGNYEVLKFCNSEVGVKDGAEQQDGDSGAAHTQFFDLWPTRAEDVKILLAACHEYLGAETLYDVLTQDLSSLSVTLGIESRFKGVKLDEVLGPLTIAGGITTQIDEVLSGLTETEHVIVDRRLIACDPLTLEEVGRDVNLTRERVRQLQARMLDRLEVAVGHELDIVGRLLSRSLGEIVPATELEQTVAGVFQGVGPVDALARRMLTDRLAFTLIGNWQVSPSAAEQVDLMRTAAREIADDVGLVDAEKLRQVVTDDEWSDHWQPLIDCCQFSSISGELALRDSMKARVKAALLKIGRTATKVEIAEVAGVDPGKIGSLLSGIPSVVRADKIRWGLRDWIDDEYEGIPAEIIQRIDEDRGATALSRLLSELPEKFNVSAVSVRSYVASPQFVVSDGYVSLADESTLAFRDLDDVIAGRDENGLPFWVFRAEDRHFDGYSLTGVPPEIARALGCPPNGHIRIDLTYPRGCPPISVSWRLTSITGASIGYVSEPLRRLGVAAGDQVKLLLSDGSRAELRADNLAAEAPGREADSPESLLERMKNRRKLL